MGIVGNIMKNLQIARLEAVENQDYTLAPGLEKAESIIFSEQQKYKSDAERLWYTGNPNDIKPNNTGTYIVIIKANFDSEDGIKKGQVYIDADFWTGDEWDIHEFGEEAWELLYFTKLKWIKFPIPEELGIKRSDDLFFK